MTKKQIRTDLIQLVGGHKTSLIEALIDRDAKVAEAEIDRQLMRFMEYALDGIDALKAVPCEMFSSPFSAAFFSDLTLETIRLEEVVKGIVQEKLIPRISKYLPGASVQINAIQVGRTSRDEVYDRAIVTFQFDKPVSRKVHFLLDISNI